ncbi:hypothetical protein DYI42_11050 [Vannielia litorea]|nr:hypothetical protein [Vannielia litorea]
MPGGNAPGEGNTICGDQAVSRLSRSNRLLRRAIIAARRAPRAQGICTFWASVAVVDCLIQRVFIFFFSCS